MCPYLRSIAVIVTPLGVPAWTVFCPIAVVVASSAGRTVLSGTVVVVVVVVIVSPSLLASDGMIPVHFIQATDGRIELTSIQTSSFAGQGVRPVHLTQVPHDAVDVAAGQFALSSLGEESDCTQSIGCCLKVPTFDSSLSTESRVVELVVKVLSQDLTDGQQKQERDQRRDHHCERMSLMWGLDFEVYVHLYLDQIC